LAVFNGDLDNPHNYDAGNKSCQNSIIG